MKNVSYQLTEKAGILLLALVLCVMLALGLKKCAQKTSQTGPYRQQLSGRIVNKFIHPRETEEGSSFRYGLIIEEKNGNLVPIMVSAEIHQQAEADLWFERNEKGTFILDNEPQK